MEMSDGTESKGKLGKKKTHGVCRRCGKNSFNLKKGYCVNCGFGKSKKRQD